MPPASSPPVRRRRLLAVAVVALAATFGPLLVTSVPAGAEESECADLAIAKERFVCSSYRSFVRRFPAFAELDYWQGQMPAKKTVFLATLGKSEESRRRIIERYYAVYSNHAPSPAEMAYWLPEVLKPNGFRRLQAGLLGAYVGTVDGFIDKAFATVLGRAASGPERTYWGTRTAQIGRTLVAADLIYTLEARRKTVVWAYYNEQFVDVDVASRDYWANRLRNGTSYLDLRIQLKTAAYVNSSGVCSSLTPPIGPTPGCET